MKSYQIIAEQKCYLLLSLRSFKTKYFGFSSLHQNPINSVAAAAAAAATLNDGSYALNTLQQNLKNRKRLEHTPSSRTVSSEESWGSERGGTNSDHEFSSDGEDDDKKSINSLTSVNTRNSHLRSTLNKAKQHLSFDKWRAASAAHTPPTPNAMPSQQPDNLSPGEAPAGRLARWFSIRRGSTHQYDFGGKNTSGGRDSRANSVELDDKPLKAQQTLNGAVINGYKMPLLPEVSVSKYGIEQWAVAGCIHDRSIFRLQTEEVDGSTTNGHTNNTDKNHSVVDAINRQLNLTLPPTPPSGLSQQQLKRRYIFASIVSSECSYVATLQRLVNVS